MSDSSSKVLVLGGGLAGLSAAVRLAEGGRKVTMLEATKAPGGRARSFPDAATGRELDNGQHLVPLERDIMFVVDELLHPHPDDPQKAPPP